MNFKISQTPPALSAEIYVDSQIKLQNLLGRTYYNPLGDQPFELLRRLVGDIGDLRVLDAGCGRGRTSSWWAENSSGTIDAFDPSRDMLTSATALLETRGLTDKVNLFQARIDNFNTDRRYHLVIAHDVLCYSTDFTGDYDRLCNWLKPGAIISLSSYSCDTLTATAGQVISCWGIQPPPSYTAISELLMNSPAKVLLCTDTSRQYQAHWQKIHELLHENWVAATELVGETEALAFAQRTDAILAAVTEGEFGHWWAVLAKPDN